MKVSSQAQDESCFRVGGRIILRAVLISQVPQPGRRSGAIDRIHAYLPNLSPAERRVGEAIISGPSDAIGMSIVEFAAKCGVAQATLTRFAQHVGFEGYPALRLSLANDRALDAPGRSHGPAEQDIQAAAQFVADDYLPMLGAAIRHAAAVEVWTEPDTEVGAELLAAELKGLGVRASWSNKPRHWDVAASALPPDSVVLLFGDDGQLGTDAGRALATARARGASIGLISRTRSSGVPKSGEYVLTLPQGSTPELASIIAAHSVTQVVRDVSHFVADGPASPWVPWPFLRDVHIPFPGHDPIPATLLTQPPDTPSSSLVVLFGGHRAPRTQALPPGVPENREMPSLTTALINRGHHVLVVENPGHGGRKREWEDAARLVGDSLGGKGEDVLETAWTQAPSIIDAVLDLPEGIDPDRIAVVGQSWGGLQAMLTTSGDERVRCVVALMPICFPTRIREYGKYRGKPRVEKASLTAERGRHLATRPLLLVSGQLDHVAPSEDVRRLEEWLRPLYDETGRGQELLHVQLAKVGHTFSADATRRMLDWVDTHLPPTGAAKGGRR
ncbi:alpha/beta fold hydrolase [Micromonospora cathayae]|uniref:Alpha/beta fold hydrolase n=1 Tax=Micromonospora cathayae TaxID=3028804 RepID=A0ABY7ZXM2_9ACTN|nr:alpha/beta fold hydrolase [Micromonospora sp. HUAS 3]WDZ87760.1 alpha/beta fold hydrolase [Micromonospora sp. HUAS 3]